MDTSEDGFSFTQLLPWYTKEQCSPCKKKNVERKKLPDPQKNTPPPAHCFLLEVHQMISPWHCAFLGNVWKSRHPARDYIVHWTRQRPKEKFKGLDWTKLVDFSWSNLGKVPLNVSDRGAVEAVTWGREQPCSSEWQSLVPVLLHMEEYICPWLDMSKVFQNQS